MTVALAGATVTYLAPGGELVRALDRVGVAIGPGESVAVMGLGGAGKSTLALAIAGLVPLRSGVRVAPARGHVAMVLQRPESALFGETVQQDAELPLALARVGADERVARVHEALAGVGLPPEFASRDPLALSGGEQRLVAIAGALVTQPAVLVLDEPAVGLDGRARATLHASLRSVHAVGVSLVVVTHDADEAAALCGRLLVLHQGRVACDAPLDAVLSDADVARGLGLQPPHAVEVAAAVARARRVVPPATCDERVLVAFLAGDTATGGGSPGAVAAPTSSPVYGQPGRSVPLALSTGPEPVPPQSRPVDSRIALGAFALVVVAAFASPSLAGAGVAVALASAGCAAAAVPPRELATALRPVVALLALLAVMQVSFGGAPEIAVWRGTQVASDAAHVALRAGQVVTVVLASLALVAGVGAVRMAGGLRWLLGPLRLLRVPVDDLALVLALGMAFAPGMVGELELLRRARRARGIDERRLGPRARVLLWQSLFVPLFTLAFRRAAQLADAMTVRGFVRGAPRTSYPALTSVGANLAIAIVAIAGAVVAVMA